MGVLADSTTLPAYVRAILVDIRRCGYADLACVVTNAGFVNSKPEETRGALRSIRAIAGALGRKSFLFDVYRRLLDSRRAPSPDPLEFVTCEDLVKGAEIFSAQPIQSGFVDRFSAADIQRLRELNLDVLLRFGFRIVRGDVLGVARYGTWSFHHGDSERYRGGPAHFWELVEESPLSGVVLQTLSEALDAGPVLAKGQFATVDSTSVSENRFVPYWSSQHFVIRTLSELHSIGATEFAKRLPEPPPYVGNRKLYRAPTNGEMAAWLIPKLATRAARRIGRAAAKVTGRASGEPVWRLGIRHGFNRLYDQVGRDDLRSFNWISKPGNGFWADPFLAVRDGKTWLFYEDFIASLGKGVIAVAELLANGQLDSARTVLEMPFHLSYPHILEEDGEFYLVPESQQSGRVDLYRSVEFPDRWVLDRTLLNFRAVDSSPFFDDGRWWMTSSPRIVPGNAGLTYVWTAQSLRGPWKLSSHRPLSSDVRTARGAGRIFRDRGRLIRPSQDGSRRYGRAISFSQLERLEGVPSESRFRLIEPNDVPGMIGIHTYNAVEKWEVVDGLFRFR